MFTRHVQRPVPASAVARLHPLSTVPQTGVLLCAAEVQGRSCNKGQKQLEATRWWWHANHAAATPAGHSSPVAALTAPDLSSMRSSDTLCRSVSWQCNRRTARVSGTSCADNLLGPTVTSDDHFLATVDPPPDWLVVSSSFDSLVLGSRSGQFLRSLSSPRGYGDSSIAKENKIIDRFLEVASATRSCIRRRVSHGLSHSPLWCARCTVTLSWLLTSTRLSPTHLGFRLLLAQAVFVLRTSFLCASSGLVRCFCLFAPNHDAHELDRHINSLRSSQLEGTSRPWGSMLDFAQDPEPFWCSIRN